MSNKLPKILVVLGPTASGKSDLAVLLSQEFNGEIISADSRQIYKNLNIGTGKITKSEMRGIKHHLLDIANPKKKFSVAEYKALAEKSVAEIIAKNKLPIICGGTGFYIDAVVEGIIFPEVPPNQKLRDELDKLSAEQLFEKLFLLDKNRAENIDKQNKVRLIRAIEIAEALGKVPQISTQRKYSPFYIGIDWTTEELQNRIHTRLLARLKHGMLTEVQKLHQNGLSWKRMQELGLEYRYLSLFLQKKISRNDMLEKLNTEIYHYAKRQLTWFKRNKKILWIKNDAKNVKILSQKIKKFLSEE